MSDVMFKEMDKVASQGLEAMLNKMIEVYSDEKKYSEISDVKYHLKQLELGLINIDGSTGVELNEELNKKLCESRNQFQLEAAEDYKKDGNFLKAASQFVGASRYKDAIDMYLKNGSDVALDKAAQFAISDHIDYKFGFDHRIQNNQIGLAFRELQDINSSDFGITERQEWGDYLTKAVYNVTIDRIKTIIEKKEGKKPEGNTISQLIEGRDINDFPGSDMGIDYEFKNSFRYAYSSLDSEMMEIGIELSVFQGKNEYIDHKKKQCKIDEIYFKAKLTGEDKYIQELIQNSKIDKENYDSYYIGQAIEVLKLHGRNDDALELAEKCLPLKYSKRLELLKELGQTKKLADAYKEINLPIKYAIVKAQMDAK